MYILNFIPSALEDSSVFLLNKKHRENFPYIYIKTSSMELNGKVWNIFDENLIILENYNQAIINAVKWHSIKSIKLYNYRFIAS